MISVSSRFDWVTLAYVQQASRSDTSLDVPAAVRRAREALEERGASVQADAAAGIVQFDGLHPRLGALVSGTIGAGELGVRRSGAMITATANAPILGAVLLTAAAAVSYLIRQVPMAIVMLAVATAGWGIWLNYVRAVRALVQTTLSLNNPNSDLQEIA